MAAASAGILSLSSSRRCCPTVQRGSRREAAAAAMRKGTWPVATFPIKPSGRREEADGERAAESDPQRDLQHVEQNGDKDERAALAHEADGETEHEADGDRCRSC